MPNAISKLTPTKAGEKFQNLLEDENPKSNIALNNLAKYQFRRILFYLQAFTMSSAIDLPQVGIN